MRFLPSFDLFDDVFDETMRRPFIQPAVGCMRTDISEKDGEYVFDMELPGYQKDDIKLSLKDGYLTITATKEQNEEEKDKAGNVIRRERHYGTTSRRFYVSKAVKEADIKAKFDNGELKIIVPKVETKEVEHQNSIPIE